MALCVLPPSKSCHSGGSCGPGSSQPLTLFFLQSSHIDQRTKPNTALEFSLEAERGRRGGVLDVLGYSSPNLVDLGGGVGLQLRHQDPHDVEQEGQVDLNKTGE